MFDSQIFYHYLHLRINKQRENSAYFIEINCPNTNSTAYQENKRERMASKGVSCRWCRMVFLVPLEAQRQRLYCPSSRSFTMLGRDYNGHYVPYTSN